MIYSRFNDARGLYDYFEDESRIPINSDLPVPTMPSPAGAIGAAAIDSGRPMPKQVRYVGQGWNARGIVVHPERRGALSGLSDLSYNKGTVALGIMIGAVIGGGAHYVFQAYTKKNWRKIIQEAVVGAAAGGFFAMAASATPKK